MPNYPRAHNPTGTYNPCWMSNGGPNAGGTVTATTWNTCIFGSPTQAGANVLANCTGWSQGRALEIYNYIHDYNPAETLTHPFETLNAMPYDWLTRAAAAGLTVVHEPREGSILVTNDHVAVVEEFDESDGLYWVSDSGYGSAVFLYQKSLYQDEQGRWCSSYSSPSKIIDGFILIPGVTPGPGPGPGPTPRRKSKFIYYLKNWNNEVY